MKLCFLTIMPSPYMRDFLAGLASDPDLDVQVLYQEQSAPDSHWEVAPLPEWSRVLPGSWIPFWGGRLHWNRGVTAALRDAQADCYIIQGYSGITPQRAMRWLTRNRRPWIFWGERPGMRQLGPPGRWLRERALRPLINGPAGIAAIGSQAASAYRQLVASGIPIANIPYHCELEPFLQAGLERVSDPRHFRVLYCGQLIERKGLRTLLDAFRSAAGETPRLRLKLVGTGPLERELRAMLTPPERDRVEFAGFRPVSELPRLFAEADLFVLPSLHDGWGVVVNQALGAGLPIVCSDAVGAAHDLVVEGGNGLLVPAGECAPLRAALLELATDSERVSRMSEHSRRLAAFWTIPRGVRRWKEFLEPLQSAHATGQNSTP
jgi:glycosyltransferase involved in cell wall biosynthesis